MGANSPPATPTASSSSAADAGPTPTPTNVNAQAGSPSTATNANAQAGTPPPTVINRAPGTTPPPTEDTDLSTLRRELAEMKAEMARQSSAATTTKPTTTALERALLDELAALRAQAATNQNSATNVSDSKVAEHMVREALYRREPFRATLDRNRAKLKGFAEGLEDNAASLNILFKEFALAARGGGLDPRDAVLLPVPHRI